MFSGDFGSHFWHRHVLVCSPHGYSVTANCCNMNSVLYACISFYTPQGTDVFSCHPGKPRIDIIPYYFGTVGKFENFPIPLFSHL